MTPESTTRGTMKYRKLRIAWSIACGLMAVLLGVLWARSYSHSDSIWRVSQSRPSVPLLHTRFSSNSGALSWTHEDGLYSLSLQVATRDSWQYSAGSAAKYIPHRFQWHKSPTRAFISIPHWFAIAVLTSLALLTFHWFHWRFSLRTLLIATTLVAILLGILAYVTNE